MAGLSNTFDPDSLRVSSGFSQSPIETLIDIKIRRCL